MKRIEQKALKFIGEQNLINKNDKILIGLSGGPDSVFLIHFLKKYSKKFKIDIGALHINHQLRGKDADKDEQFCKKLCEKLSVEFYSVKKDVKAYSKDKKISIEAAGRKIRYNEYERILKEKGYNKIATAHNADENAETVLLNLIKGSGLRGLSGIPPKRNNIIRPVLCLTKEEILLYLKENKIKYRTDLTNFTDDAERNYLRNKVIPLISGKLNPSFSNTVLKSSEVLRKIYNLINKNIQQKAGKLVKQNDDYVTISIDEFNKIDEEYRSEILRYIFDKYFDVQISFNDCDKILSLINKQTGRSTFISGKIKIVRERNDLLIKKEKLLSEEKVFTVKPGETIKLNDHLLSIKEVGTIIPGHSSNKNLEYINGDNTSDTFLVRRWLPGERFFPFGMKGSKKVSDFLNEQKILSVKKKEQLVLLNNDRIVWVIGLRLDERFRITPETKKVYQLCLS